MLNVWDTGGNLLWNDSDCKCAALRPRSFQYQAVMWNNSHCFDPDILLIIYFVYFLLNSF